MASNKLAELYNFCVSINQDGNIILDYRGPPDSEDIEKVFDAWDSEYEHTKKIVTLCEYLRNYSKVQEKDINGIISV